MTTEEMRQAIHKQRDVLVFERAIDVGLVVVALDKIMEGVDTLNCAVKHNWGEGENWGARQVSVVRNVQKLLGIGDGNGAPSEEEVEEMQEVAARLPEGDPDYAGNGPGRYPDGGV